MTTNHTMAGAKRGRSAAAPVLGRAWSLALEADGWLAPPDPGPEPGGEPPVLLLHGSGPGVSAAANWRAGLPAMRQRRRVLAPDQLGFGRTATGAAGSAESSSSTRWSRLRNSKRLNISFSVERSGGDSTP